MKITFDAEKSLFSLTIVHIIILISFSLAIATSLIIGLHAYNIPWDFSGDGFSRFVELFKVPLAILAIGLTLIGLCGANHRSEQTKAQIKRTSDQIAMTSVQIQLTRSQNNFSNYFKHVEEFEKYREAQNTDFFKSKANRNLHLKLFPSARDGDFSASADSIEFLELNIDEIRTAFMTLLSLPQALVDVNLIETITKRRAKIADYFSSDLNRPDGPEFTIKNKTVKIPNSTLLGLLYSAQDAVEHADLALQFDEKYTSPPTVAEFLSWDHTSSFFSSLRNPDKIRAEISRDNLIDSYSGKTPP